MFLLFNHKLTESQKNDAEKSLKVTEFLYFPEELQKLWSQVPATLSKSEVGKFLIPIKEWILDNSEENSVALIQGDFGATFEMVEFCQTNKITPFHSTNRRVAKEVHDGDKVHVSHTFEHVIFREY
jgi:hypothetical protein